MQPCARTAVLDRVSVALVLRARSSSPRLVAQGLTVWAAHRSKLWVSLVITRSRPAPRPSCPSLQRRLSRTPSSSLTAPRQPPQDAGEQFSLARGDAASRAWKPAVSYRACPTLILHALVRALHTALASAFEGWGPVLRTARVLLSALGLCCFRRGSSKTSSPTKTRQARPEGAVRQAARAAPTHCAETRCAGPGFFSPPGPEQLPLPKFLARCG